MSVLPPLPDEVEIETTKADYDNGERLNCLKCLVALAVRRAVPGRWVEVDSYPLEVRIGDAKYDFVMGEHLPEWFDNGVPPQDLIGKKIKLKKRQCQPPTSPA